MIQLSKEDTINRYKAYLSKVHPIKPVHKQTQDKLNTEVIKAINELESTFPSIENQSFHYSEKSPELWRNIVMTYLIQYNNQFPQSGLVPFEIIDFYRLIEIFLAHDEQYVSLHQLTSPILFIRDEMTIQNKETENIVMQLLNFRRALPSSKSNPHHTILLSTHSLQWLRAKFPKVLDAVPNHYNVNN